VEIGTDFPQIDIGDDPAGIRDYAQAAEALEYSCILAYDHVLGADPNREGGWRGYTNDDAFHEPLTLFAFLAGVTRTIEFATGILILPQRQTVLVAKQAAEVANLSGGRLRLGVGTGWNYIEYEALGENFHNRGRREEEQVDLLRRLWNEPVLDYNGRWHRIDRAGLKPRPRQRIPIWFGGWAEVVLERTARLGDGWFAGPFRGDPTTGDLVSRLHAYLRAAGRDPATFPIEGVVGYADGNPETWRRHLNKWKSIGATHCVLDTMRCGFTTPGQHIEALRRFVPVRDEYR
jgi:probable F420-dependent oxidoreductase